MSSLLINVGIFKDFDSAVDMCIFTRMNIFECTNFIRKY